MDTMHADASRIGASFISKRSADNPRELLIKLIEDNKEATKDDLFRMFQDQIDSEASYQRAVNWYFFVNMYEYAVTGRNNKSQEARGASKARVSAMAESIKEQIAMLDFPMTNGKLLGDCTGGELSTMSNRYQKLAERVGKAKTVRSVLTEDQVKAILR